MKTRRKRLQLAKETVLALEAVAAGTGCSLITTVRYSCFDGCESNQLCTTAVRSIEIGCF